MKESEYKDLRQRDEYIDSIDRLLERLGVEAEQNRKDALAKAGGKENLRRQYFAMLGYPLTTYVCDPNINVKTELPIAYDGMITTRYQLEVLPGFWLYGMLYEHKDSDRAKKNALIIAQHGGLGSPEIVGSLVNDSANYNHMVRRVIGEDRTVFAPQLLLWDRSVYEGKEYDRNAVDLRLRQFGGSITGLEVYCVMRCIDYFAGRDWIDGARVGMIGLSYGGMYTLYTAAADTRIKAALSSCWFNDRLEYKWPDWVFFNQANLFMDAEVGSLVLPRKLYVEIGTDDTLFDYRKAEADFERLRAYAEAEGRADSLRIKVFDGGHELDTAEDGIQFLLEGLG